MGFTVPCGESPHLVRRGLGEEVLSEGSLGHLRLGEEEDGSSHASGDLLETMEREKPRREHSFCCLGTSLSIPPLRDTLAAADRSRNL